MAIHIENLDIINFRGISNLYLDNLNHVNIIAGDNNSGKTSVLEAIMLLQNPNDFNNVLRISRIRERGSRERMMPMYDCFMSIFPRNALPLEISIHSLCMGKAISIQLFGEQKKIMLSHDELVQNVIGIRMRENIKRYPDGLEVNAFEGLLLFDVGGSTDSIPIEFHTHSKITGRELSLKNYLNIVYISPIDHIITGVLAVFCVMISTKKYA